MKSPILCSRPLIRFSSFFKLDYQMIFFLLLPQRSVTGWNVLHHPNQTTFGCISWFRFFFWILTFCTVKHTWEEPFVVGEEWEEVCLYDGTSTWITPTKPEKNEASLTVDYVGLNILLSTEGIHSSQTNNFHRFPSGFKSHPHICLVSSDC